MLSVVKMNVIMLRVTALTIHQTSLKNLFRDKQPSLFFHKVSDRKQKF
jgi:hypothetical protein